VFISCPNLGAGAEWQQNRQRTVKVSVFTRSETLTVARFVLAMSNQAAWLGQGWNKRGWNRQRCQLPTLEADGHRWSNLRRVERPPVGSTSVNHHCWRKRSPNRVCRLWHRGSNPRMVGRTVKDGLCCSGPCPTVPATRLLGPSCANGWPAPALALPAPITRSDPVVSYYY
jgi:hypothetical protein